MNSLNQIIIEGNICRKPEKITAANGVRICRFPIAVNRFTKNQTNPAEPATEEVSYFDIDTFGNLADACEKWCPSGRGVRVVGRLKQDRWENNDGKKVSKVKIIAEHVEFKPYKKMFENGSSDSEKNEDINLNNVSSTKKQKLDMLAKAAAETQTEQEDGEVTF